MQTQLLCLQGSHRRPPHCTAGRCRDFVGLGKPTGAPHGLALCWRDRSTHLTPPSSSESEKVALGRS